MNPLQGPRESWLGSRQEKLHQLHSLATALGGSGPEDGYPDLGVLCPRGHLPVSAQPHPAFGQESRPEATKTSGAPVLVACPPTRTRVVQVSVPPPTHRRTAPPGSGCFQLTQGPGKSSVGDGAGAGAGATQPALGGLVSSASAVTGSQQCPQGSLIAQRVSEVPSFLRLNTIPSCAPTKIGHSASQPASCGRGLLPPLAVMNDVVGNPAMNTDVHVAFCHPAFNPLDTRKWNCWVVCYFCFRVPPSSDFPCFQMRSQRWVPSLVTSSSASHVTCSPLSRFSLDFWIFLSSAQVHIWFFIWGRDKSVHAQGSGGGAEREEGDRILSRLCADSFKLDTGLELVN